MKLAAEPGAVLALGIFILGGCGMLGRPLLPWRARPFLCLVAPLFGLVLVGWLARVLGAAGLALASAAWCFVALAALGWTMALVRGRLRRPNRQIALVLAVCCVALALAAWPVASFGRLTSVGATADAVAAARLSEQLQGQPLPLGDRTPTLAHTAELYVLGLLALLSRHRAFEVSTLMMALFFALTPAAVFVWARLGLRLARGGALLAAGFVAVSNLLLWAVFDNFLAQVVATSLFPLVLAFGALGSRRPGWRDAATCGSLLGATATIYPVFAVYAALCVAAVWLAAQLRRRAAATLLQGVRFGLAAAGAAVVVDGLSLPRSWSYLRYVAAVARPGGARLVGFGDLLVFPSVYEVAGLTSHVASALNVRPWPLPRGAVSALALAAAACAVYGCLSLARGSRLALALPLAVLAGLAAAQRFAVNRPDGYPYGYYKTVSLLALVTAAALAAGLLAVARRPRWRAAAGLAAAAILGLNLMNSWWTVRYTIGHTALTPEVIDLAQAAAFLPPRAVVFTDIDPGLEQQWIRYLWWQRVAVFARGDPLPAGRSPFLRWALIEKRPGEDRRPAGEPWYEPASYRVLWQNGRFALRQRRDATLARLTWDQPLLQPGEVLELELAPARGCVRGTLGGRPAAAELGTGEPRGLLISAFGAGGGPARLAVEGEQPLALGPGGWQLAEDLVCRGSLRPVRIHNLGTSGVLVSEVAASSLSPGRSGGCLAATPLAAGLAYVEQQVAPPEVAYTVRFWPPRSFAQRRYLLGIHVADTIAGRPLGAWSLRFAAVERQQIGALRINLATGEAAARLDGQAAPVEANALHLGRGELGPVTSFDLQSVIWQLDPTVQISVDRLLSFERVGETSIRAVAVSPRALTVIPGARPAG